MNIYSKLRYQPEAVALAASPGEAPVAVRISLLLSDDSRAVAGYQRPLDAYQPTV